MHGCTSETREASQQPHCPLGKMEVSTGKKGRTDSQRPAAAAAAALAERLLIVRACPEQSGGANALSTESVASVTIALCCCCRRRGLCIALTAHISSFGMSDTVGGGSGGGGGASTGGGSDSGKDRGKDRGKKRKQYQPGGANKKSKHGAAVDLNKGITGYLVTCEQGKEQHCQREVIAWLTHYADLLYPSSEETDDSGDAVADGAEVADDRPSVSNALAAELAELKQQQRQPRSSKARFVSLDTGVRGIVFIHSRHTAVDHIALLYRMMTDITSTKRLYTRYTIRIHPLHRTCFSRPDDLYAIAQPLLASLLPALPTRQQPQQPTQPATPRTFSIQLNKRGNHALFDRNNVITKLASMWERGWTVDLDEPSVVCVVEVCGRMAGIGLVERWHEFNKFNVRALGEEVYRNGQSGEKIEATLIGKDEADESVGVEVNDESEVKGAGL